MKRRTVLAGVAGLTGLSAAGCAPRDEAAPAARWLGAGAARGHRLRDRAGGPAPAVRRRAEVVIVGAGIAGLAAARGFAQQGIDDIAVLELEDQAGGNSRGHRVAGMACPTGAHYLPLPPPQAHEVSAWLHEIGLLRHELGRSVPDERHLCHSPQERLFIDGAWAEGLLPPADEGSATAKQYARFAQAVQAERTERAERAVPQRFTLPAHRGRWDAGQAALDTQTFAHWLAAQRLDDPKLLWYLDYACRDDYGAGIHSVSAWAGIHYFASRHGFAAPGDAGADRDAVFTWPEGNAWLVQRLAAPLGERVHTARTVLQVIEERHAVQVLAWDETRAQLEAWAAQRVVLATPLFVSARLLRDPPDALRQAAALLTHAPWLVANVHIDAPLLDRPGAPPSWDNVRYGATALGYVDAMHQSLRVRPGPTVLTAYHALPTAERGALLAADAAHWRDRVLAELALMHPDIHRRTRQVDLMRWGHAMAIPCPGVQRHAALTSLRAARGRVRFAHADLAGCSVFEEAFTAGAEAARRVRA